MKKISLLLALGATLASCTPSETPVVKIDQQKRQELFEKCMASLPAGPEKTVYNDWDEVVEACSNQAYYTSLYCAKFCDESTLPMRKPE